MQKDQKDHWENVYATKSPNEVSWTQAIPKTSIELIESCGNDKSASIIDIGGGDSNLVDHLLDLGYENISVLDISAKAIERAKSRLGEKAEKVQWIVSNVVDFQPNQKFDIWHDRAAFHFLTDESDIHKYVELTSNFVSSNLIIGTFSKAGPLKCSGLEISQYDENSLLDQFSEVFNLVNCRTEDHLTPFETKQNFLFCKLKRK